MFNRDAPFFLSIGMTATEYWHGDPWLIRQYYEAEKLRQKRLDAQAWLQGAYIYDALARIAPLLQAFPAKGAKVQEYPPKSYSVTRDEEQRAMDEEQEALRARIYMENMVRAGRGWGKKK